MGKDIHDFIHGLVPAQEKVASSLELEAFDHLLAQPDDEEEKVAYGMMGGGSEDWLSRFQHTPLYEKAIALKEKDLALEKRRMEERQRREKAYRHDDSTWNEQDKLCLEKDKLTLELHRWRASQEAKTKLKMQVMKVAGNGDPLREKMRRLGQIKKAGSYSGMARDENKRVQGRRKVEDARRASPVGRAVGSGLLGGVVGHYLGDTVTRGTKHNQKGRAIGSALGMAAGGYSGYQMGKAVRDLQDREKKKKAELVEYTGHVNNGEPQAPEWPRAALGVDSAGRRATPEELRPQTNVRNPDVQHVTPQSGGEEFERKVSSLIVGAVEGARGLPFSGRVKEAFIRLPGGSLGGRMVSYVGGSGARGAVSQVAHAAPAVAAGKSVGKSTIRGSISSADVQRHVAEDALRRSTERAKGTLLEGLSNAPKNPFAREGIAAPGVGAFSDLSHVTAGAPKPSLRDRLSALKERTMSASASKATPAAAPAVAARPAMPKPGASISERLAGVKERAMGSRTAIVPQAPSAGRAIATSPTVAPPASRMLPPPRRLPPPSPAARARLTPLPMAA